MIIPCDDGFAEDRAAVIRSIDRGSLPPKDFITDRLLPSEAPSLFSHLCESGSGSSISAVIR